MSLLNQGFPQPLVAPVALAVAQASARPVTGALGAPAPVDTYAANGFSPDYVADFSATDADYFRVAGVDSDFETAFTSDSEGGGLAVQNDSSGNLVWRAHNLAPYSESLADWSLVGATRSGQTLTASAATGSQAAYIVADGSSAFQRTSAVNVTKGTHDFIQLLFRDGAGSYASVVADLSVPEISETQTAGSSITASSVVENADGSFTIAVTGVPTSFATRRLTVGFAEFATGNTYASGGIIQWQTAAAGTETVTINRAWSYRSDLGGMAPNPDRSTDTDYVPTTTAARYLARRRHHRWDGSAYVPTCLHEPVGATNLVDYSNRASDWVGSSATVTADAAASPDGGTNAIRVEATAGAGNHYAQYSSAFSVDPVAEDYCYSVYVKDEDAGFVHFYWAGGAPDILGQYVIDLSDGSIAQSFVAADNVIVTNAGNGYWRISLVDVSDGDSGNPSLFIGPHDGSASASWTASGGESILFYGAQVEKGSLPSSYIPTNGSTVTRTADTLKGKAASLPYSSTAMSAAFKGRVSYIDDAGLGQLLFERQAAANERFELYLDCRSSDTGEVLAVTQTSTEMTLAGSGSQYTPGVLVPVSGAMRNTTVALQAAQDGVAGTEASATDAVPAVSGADLLLFAGPTLGPNGQIDTIRLWDEDIAEAGLIESTS